MNKKFQIFLSSTYLDLKLERQAAVEAILLAGHIPAGMELFSAGDQSQLEVIRRWIEDSDIYMLILGGRYGSVDSRSNLSYIELEYDHAVASGKPLFALVLSEDAMRAKIVSLGEHASESDNRDKYEAFRQKVLTKISRTVDDAKDIKIYTLEAIRNIEQRDDLIGWVKGNDAVDVQPFLSKIASLTDEGNDLRHEVARLSALTPQPVAENLAGLGDDTTVRVRFKMTGYPWTDQVYRLKWSDVFALIAPKLLEHPNDAAVKPYLKAQLMARAGDKGDIEEINEQDFQQIKIQLEALGLIKTEYSMSKGSGMQLYWALTEAGKTAMINVRAQKKPEAKVSLRKGIAAAD